MSIEHEAVGTYQGFDLLEAHWSRTGGLDPDRGRVTMLYDVAVPQPIKGVQAGAPGANPVGGTQVEQPAGADVGGQALNIFGDLTFSLRSAGGPLTFKRVYVDQSGWKVVKKDRQGGSGKIIEVALTDERWRWQQEGHVSGRHNMLVPDGGVPVQGQGGLFDPFTLKDGNKLKTLGELVAICVKQLAGRPQILIEPKSGAFHKIKPLSINWGSMTLAAQALNDLLSEFGIYVTYTLNNNLHFWDYGDDGEQNPESINSEFLAQKLDLSVYNYRPNSIEVVGGRKVIQAHAQSFDPVIEYDQDEADICEGEVIALREFAQRTKLDFERISKSVLSMTKKEKGAWQWVEEELGTDRGKRVAKLFQKCAFKWFRINYVWKAFLPWVEELPLLTDGRKDANKCPRKQPFAVRVLGTTFLPDDESDWSKESGYFVNKAKVDLSPYLSEVDYKNGILKFARPIGWLEPKDSKLVISPAGTSLKFSNKAKQNAKKWNQVLKEIRELADKNAVRIRAYREVGFKGSGVVAFDPNSPLDQQIAKDIAARLRQIALVDERARDAAVAALEKAGESGDYVNLEEMVLREPLLSVDFAFENSMNKFEDCQSDEYYRFKLEIKKDDDVGDVYRLNDPSLVEFFPLRGEPNTQILDEKAKELISAVFNNPDGSPRQSAFVDVNWEFYGPQRIQASARVQQVAWTMSKTPPTMRTVALTRDVFRGSMGRNGTVALPARAFNRADLMSSPIVNRFRKLESLRF